jgi:RNA polymerase sigma factor (sigma-70 family)
MFTEAELAVQPDSERPYFRPNGIASLEEILAPWSIVVMTGGGLSRTVAFSIHTACFFDWPAKRNAFDEARFARVAAYVRGLEYRPKRDLGLEYDWQSFWEHHSILLRNAFDRSGISPQDSDDCAQDVWAQVVTHFSRGSGSPDYRRFLSWLWLVIRSKVATYFRMKARNETTIERSAAETLVSDPESDPAVDCIRREERQAIRACLEELRGSTSQITHEVFRKRSFKGLSVAAVAADLGLSREQVWYRQHRAYKVFFGIVRRRMG